MPLTDVQWTVVHQMYLKKSPKKEDLAFWRRFLIKLGVKKGLHVKRVDEYVPEVYLSFQMFNH